MKIDIISKMNQFKNFIITNKTGTLMIVTGTLIMMSVLTQQIFLFLFAMFIWSIPLPICILITCLKQGKQVNK